MAKKSKLLPQQINELKRQYLQKDDAELAALIGSDVKTVKAELKRLKLVRGKWTDDKIKARKEADSLKNIEVDSETVKPEGNE